jgi:hypothetical protein
MHLLRDIMFTSPVSLSRKQRKCRHLAGDLNASRTAHPLHHELLTTHAKAVAASCTAIHLRGRAMIGD